MIIGLASLATVTPLGNHILSDWLRRRRSMVREVKATFMKLLEVLVASRVSVIVWG